MHAENSAMVVSRGAIKHANDSEPKPVSHEEGFQVKNSTKNDTITNIITEEQSSDNKFSINDEILIKTEQDCDLEAQYNLATREEQIVVIKEEYNSETITMKMENKADAPEADLTEEDNTKMTETEVTIIECDLKKEYNSDTESNLYMDESDDEHKADVKVYKIEISETAVIKMEDEFPMDMNVQPESDSISDVPKKQEDEDVIEISDTEDNDSMAAASATDILRGYIMNAANTERLPSIEDMKKEYTKFHETGHIKHLTNIKAIYLSSVGSIEVIDLVDDDDDENEESPLKKQKEIAE